MWRPADHILLPVLPCYSLFFSVTSMTYRFNLWPNILVEKDSLTCFRASPPMLTAISGSRISLAMAKENSSGMGLQRKPVTPSLIVSTGPPLLHPMTGLWAAIASKGTMPKCSSCISPRIIFRSFLFLRSDQVRSRGQIVWHLWCVKDA